MSELPSNLRYSDQDEPGLSRRRRGRGFSYHYETGRLVQCTQTLSRIKALGLPPAYEKVWICRDDKGHLQAAGTDERGRRQYRYHPHWRQFRDRQKFDRLEQFGRGLPRLRSRIETDLDRQQPDKKQVCAALVRLIDRTALRVGSERYVKENATFGAATLRSHHLKLDGATLHLSFKSKGGKRVRKQIKDKTLAKVLGHIDDLPGRRLFTCVAQNGSVDPVLSEDVNQYIAAAMRDDRFTAKTFRTWHGSLAALSVARSTDTSLTIKAMAEATADRLNNTPAIARSSYIHPAIIDLVDLDDSELHQRFDALDLRAAPNALPTDEKYLVAYLSQQGKWEP